MSKDLIELYCKGRNSLFDQQCGYFLVFSHECSLLKDVEDMTAIFEPGNARCDPCNMVKAAVKGNLERYADLIAPQDYLESLTFEIVERLKNTRLKKGGTLVILKGCINKSAYNQVMNLLAQEGILPSGVCGECIHLVRSSSSLMKYHCQRETLCHEKGEELLNPHFHKKRNPSFRACRRGFEPFQFTPLKDASPVSAVSEPLVDFWEQILDLLEERVNNAQISKRRQMCKRQYMIFARLRQLLESGFSRKEAVNEIMKECGIRRKMLEHDLLEVKNFLTKKCPEFQKILS